MAYTGACDHECTKRLLDILSPLRFHSTSLEDTISCIDHVKYLSGKDSVMYTFGVVNFFTNISLQFTIQLILDSIFKYNVDTFYNLNKQRLKTLLNWAASSTTLQFPRKKYKQVNGVGNSFPLPLSWQTYSIYELRNTVEEALSASQQNKTTVLPRYVEDLFLFF